VSGVTTKLADRPGGRRLFDKIRAGDQVICRWVDRLGKNYDDATSTIRHLMVEGVIVKTVINATVFDGSTTDPIQKAVRDAMIAFMAATCSAMKAESESGAATSRTLDVLATRILAFLHVVAYVGMLNFLHDLLIVWC
jgi:putative DNA-invertase from lambdoid prophage Rac